MEDISNKSNLYDINLILYGGNVVKFLLDRLICDYAVSHVLHRDTHYASHHLGSEDLE